MKNGEINELIERSLEKRKEALRIAEKQKNEEPLSVNASCIIIRILDVFDASYTEDEENEAIPMARIRIWVNDNSHLGCVISYSNFGGTETFYNAEEMSFKNKNVSSAMRMIEAIEGSYKELAEVSQYFNKSRQGYQAEVGKDDAYNIFIRDNEDDSILKKAKEAVEERAKSVEKEKNLIEREGRLLIHQILDVFMQSNNQERMVTEVRVEICSVTGNINAFVSFGLNSWHGYMELEEGSSLRQAVRKIEVEEIKKGVEVLEYVFQYFTDIPNYATRKKLEGDVRWVDVIMVL